MKKLLAIIFWIAGSFSIYALPLGNPAEPALFKGDDCSLCDRFLGPFSFRAGYYGNFVYDRHLRNRRGGSIHRTKVWTDAAYLAVNICDRVDIFTSLGSSKIRLESFGNAFLATLNPTLAPDTPALSLDIIDWKPHFSWSIGARALLFEWCSFGIGAEGEYFRIRPRLNFASDRAVFLEYRDDIRAKYFEWQLGVAAYYRFAVDCSFLTAACPYAGIKWSRALFDMGNAFIPDSRGFSITSSLTLLNQHSSRFVGYAVGVSTVFCNRFGLTVEGRFRDERALYVNGQIRF